MIAANEPARSPTPRVAGNIIRGLSTHQICRNSDCTLRVDRELDRIAHSQTHIRNCHTLTSTKSHVLQGRWVDSGGTGGTIHAARWRESDRHRGKGKPRDTEGIGETKTEVRGRAKGEVEGLPEGGILEYYIRTVLEK